jgi:hypothetical protein
MAAMLHKKGSGTGFRLGRLLPDVGSGIATDFGSPVDGAGTLAGFGVFIFFVIMRN